MASNLKLRENGLLLGPAHSQHADIRSHGGGRFSHWNDVLYFSTSDGTDPRANGRSCTASLRPRLSAAVSVCVLLTDVVVVFFLRRWLLKLLVSAATLAARLFCGLYPN